MSKDGKGARKVSFVNWLITLFFSVLPGANIVFFILTMVFARNSSKRSFATAALVLTLILTIAICVAIIFFGQELADFFEEIIRDGEEIATPASV